jgi:hypothetical protein
METIEATTTIMITVIFSLSLAVKGMGILKVDIVGSIPLFIKS